MPDMWFDVDTAIAGCPVNRMPLIDATDFKTIEDAVVYNAAGLALFWHFTTSAGVRTTTAVTPTSAGNYDWTDHSTSGMYSIEIPASGGASINNDAEGYGWFTGVATGVLPWTGPIIGFRAAALNDALCDGGDNLDINVVQWLGTVPATPTVAGVPEVDVTHVAGVSGGPIPITSNTKKNQALANFALMMTDSTNHLPATGKTVTVTRSIDGASFAAGTLSAVTEISNGMYRVDFAAADLNGNVIILRCTAAACDDTLISIVTAP